MRMKAWATLLALLLAGCGGERTAFGVEDDQFVDTMVELRRAAQNAGADTVAFREARARVLEERGLTEAALREYVERRSTDLNGMAAVWDSVNARLTQEEAQ